MALPAALCLWLALPAAAEAKASGCHSGAPVSIRETGPASLTGSLEAGILAQYAVLRRPAMPSDSLPAINPAADTIEYSLSGYYESEIRQVLARPDGERFFIVPGLPRALDLPPLRCVPKKSRRSLQKLKEESLKRSVEPAYCVVDLGGRPSIGPSACVTFAEVPDSRRLFALPLAGGPSVMLVPDGVSSVRVTGPGSLTQTLAVSENAYLYEAPASLVRRRERLIRRLIEAEPKKHPTAADRRRQERAEHAAFLELKQTEPLKAEWLAPSGEVLRTIGRPRSSSLLSLFVP